MQSTKSGASETRTNLQHLARRFNATDAFALTALPGGKLQIAHTLHPRDAIVRRYGTEFFAKDAFAGTVMRETSGRWAGADSVWQAAGFGSGIGITVKGPILAGYPGVILLFRAADAAAFTEADLRELVDESEPAGDRGLHVADLESVDAGMLLYSAPDALIWPVSGVAAFDERLAENVATQVKKAFGRSEAGSSGRVGVADATGEHVPFQFIRFDEHPVAAGPVVVACRLPGYEDWAKVSSADFDADGELTRLIPAVEYMVEHFSEGPTLEDIAASVHLSQFHFHRRFSELLGVTPKHLLFDLQLHLAKSLLADPARGLADIAKVCGFAHQSHFTSRFKQGTGLTPTRWRRLHDVR